MPSSDLPRSQHDHSLPLVYSPQGPGGASPSDPYQMASQEPLPAAATGEPVPRTVTKLTAAMPAPPAPAVASSLMTGPNDDAKGGGDAPATAPGRWGLPDADSIPPIIPPASQVVEDTDDSSLPQMPGNAGAAATPAMKGASPGGVRVVHWDLPILPRSTNPMKPVAPVSEKPIATRRLI